MLEKIISYFTDKSFAKAVAKTILLGIGTAAIYLAAVRQIIIWMK
ncbi:MAG TPA: hypothetical protein PKU96_02950 [bacterium]|jgi:hypothetical protein|nr:MAG: hypothetical protein BWY40_00998 [bacterium ADurb.Bin270]HPW45312.1 hypothetical protein [bacterium]HQG13313.1 hypothetical protein [bacterium]HQH80601.1 hypothetical protein [bacterium]